MPVSIDADSTIIEVHGHAKQGASYGYTRRLGYYPLLAARAGTGEVLHAPQRAWAPPPPAAWSASSTATASAASSPATATPGRWCTRRWSHESPATRCLGGWPAVGLVREAAGGADGPSTALSREA